VQCDWILEWPQDCVSSTKQNSVKIFYNSCNLSASRENFSKAGQILSAQRNRLLPKNVDQLICLNKNIYKHWSFFIYTQVSNKIVWKGIYLFYFDKKVCIIYILYLKTKVKFVIVYKLFCFFILEIIFNWFESPTHFTPGRSYNII